MEHVIDGLDLGVRRNLLARLSVCLCASAFACGGNGTLQGAATPMPTAGSNVAPTQTNRAGSVGAAGDSGAATAGVPGASGVSGASPSLGAAGAHDGAGSTVPAAGSGGVASPPPVSGSGAQAAAGNSAGASGASGTAGGSQAGAAAPSGVLSSMDTLLPDASWSCGMPDGIPPASGALVFEADLQLGEIYDIGDTQYGHRHQIEIKGGTLTGPKIKGTFMDRGLDYQLTLANGALEIEEINILKTSDGSSIYFKNCGASPGPGSEVRMVPDFEAPTASAYAFLNTGKFVGTRVFDPDKKTLKISVHEASAMVDKSHAVQVVEPTGIPNQTWDCKKAAGTKGAVVYMESVGIGDGSVAVGASKNGTRNIIPITGGTTTGRVAGGVLSGGADYQLIGSTFVLDARYTLHTMDGEYIIVRNCGPVGGLVPVFETRTNGKYAWLNANTWLSSDPGVGAGVVNLTIYEGGK